MLYGCLYSDVIMDVLTNLFPQCIVLIMDLKFEKKTLSVVKCRLGLGDAKADSLLAIRSQLTGNRYGFSQKNQKHITTYHSYWELYFESTLDSYDDRRTFVHYHTEDLHNRYLISWKRCVTAKLRVELKRGHYKEIQNCKPTVFINIPNRIQGEKSESPDSPPSTTIANGRTVVMHQWWPNVEVSVQQSASAIPSDHL
ncbi:hypothetical protein CR513_00072, partial [Mucuna pruriens]